MIEVRPERGLRWFRREFATFSEALAFARATVGTDPGAAVLVHEPSTGRSLVVEYRTIKELN